MKIDKQFIVRNLITILCALCVVALFFTFVSLSIEVESSFVDFSPEPITSSGWDALSNYTLGWVLLIGPVLLVAMNYIRKLERFKGLLAIFVPILCIVILFFTLSNAKAYIGFADSAMDSVGDLTNSVLDSFDFGGYDDYDDYSTDSSADASAGLGFYMLLVANIGIIISGAVTYFGLRLDDLSTVKESGRAILSTAREVTTSVRSEGSGAPAASPIASAPTASPVASAPPARPKAPESVIKTGAEDALQLIERLAKMRDSGILTEEEFQEKKRDLLKGV